MTDSTVNPRQTNVVPEMIGLYLNRYLWSDIEPIGKIVGIKGKHTVLVKRIEAGENKSKMDFVAGGFSAVCLNQYDQRYDFTETEEVTEIRLSKLFFKQAQIDTKPRKFYDYNF
jgi:hypothetical protein